MKRIIHYSLDEDDTTCGNCGEDFGLDPAFYDNDTFLVICKDCAIEIDPDLEWRMNG